MLIIVHIFIKMKFWIFHGPHLATTTSLIKSNIEDQNCFILQFDSNLNTNQIHPAVLYHFFEKLVQYSRGYQIVCWLPHASIIGFTLYCYGLQPTQELIQKLKLPMCTVIKVVKKCLKIRFLLLKIIGRKILIIGDLI